MRKVTMKDVAKLAEVSIATVSYVLNNSKKESIPEDTRNKVLTVAKELGYVPNLTARSLVRKQSMLIGILVVRDYENEHPWKKCYYSELINEMEKILFKSGYHVLITNIDSTNPNLEVILERELDGVFIIDVNKDLFYNLSNKFIVPIIVIDSLIDDLFFHKILPDFRESITKCKQLLNEKDSFLILNRFNNTELTESIFQCFDGKENDIYIADSIDGIENFLKDKQHRKGIVINEFLAILAAHFINPNQLSSICTSGNDFLLNKDIKRIVINNKEKAQIAVDTMIDYINKNYPNNKSTYVKAE